MSIIAYIREIAAKLPDQPADQESPRPQAEKMPAALKRCGFFVSAMGGRSANGAHRDAGELYHAIESDEPEIWATHVPALCGARPGGRRSYGWREILETEPHEITCPRCLAAIARRQARAQA